MRYCYEIFKVAVEPSAATGLAVVLSNNFKRNPLWNSSQNIGIVLSKGDVELGVLWESYGLQGT
ncbi:putative serine racemase, Ammonia-lyase [Helianthus annuus]|uniref:Serine racemase, Ammonia-lyase n=2 Tax=Helianthus annuus TaxID=4232 RepID=A0A9K3H139_HELAN|nr:putative serine racemase, Ammonia-lyase [Helianthus annuus]KAJ0450168.1 putative serine racemase, Ammonia-lyase [Helianthus annuus]KAJ0454169.1 putative serine racemase, Ammonia-lyase [Helianthus annuus]KAJ0471961.1 putative serine racemase, Ammonia-lyase [Helianthus annuus]KAJ0647556.1 putative serine racemase, Ammonia-lyase [Helianthus annuus]